MIRNQRLGINDKESVIKVIEIYEQPQATRLTLRLTNNVCRNEVIFCKLRSEYPKV